MKTAILVSLSFCCATAAFAQGSLTPPGAPGPTMKTLQQVEPRTPISSLPFTITNRGSYYVTTNLNSGGGGIIIETNDVSVDLNGFTLTSNGSLFGIAVLSARNNLVVRNGIFRNWGSGVGAGLTTHSTFEDLHVTGGSGAGINTGNYCQVLRCTVSGNTNAGIFAGDYCTISECHASGNANNGIRTGDHGQVIGSTASGNTNAGILTGTYATVFRCYASTNGGNGVQVTTGSKISECSSVLNRGHGIVLVNYGTVQDSTAKGNALNGIDSGGAGANAVRNCLASDNGGNGIDLGSCCNVVADCLVALNDREGILVDNDSRIVGNMVHSNTSATNNGAGIRLSFNGNHVEDNTTWNNDVGILSSGASFIIRNTARQNGTNYHFVGAQNAGPIVGAGTITTNNPWANFSY